MPKPLDVVALLSSIAMMSREAESYSSETQVIDLAELRQIIFEMQNSSGRHAVMQCSEKNELEQHLSDIRRLATRLDLTSEEKEAAVRAERFAIELLREHDASGHNGKRCPLATQI